MGTGLSAVRLFCVATGTIRSVDPGTIGVLVMLGSLLGMLCAVALPHSWRTNAPAGPGADGSPERSPASDQPPA